MSEAELSKIYSPREVERHWYQFWEDNDFFRATVRAGKRCFSVVIPPPNVTNILTMGHVVDNVPQDIIVRWRRMQGYETVWVPGMDHAGIATQNVVERKLAQEGRTRHDLGREKFVQAVWEWKEKYGIAIIAQLKRLGCSCDWERLRFTMDDGLSRAVQEAFIRLYNKGLIYRGNYIINWCPRCQTALSDEEVDHEETRGHLWYIKYPLKEADEFITVATTRPETMFGDTGVAVNPRDRRYRHLAGKMAIVPIIGRNIPVVTDDLVDPEFGTGAVKVTPAHDANDFSIGERQGLHTVMAFDEKGIMTENAGPYRGQDRFQCRENAVRDLKAGGLLVKIEEHDHSVGHCYRCKAVVEPYLSEQWFVRMKPLAEPAIEAVKRGEIVFYPPRWEKVYLDWLEKIRDWCISRQLWWGHRIPVWYCQSCGQAVARTEHPGRCTRCEGEDFQQDPDVLDTWFSSWLWPFSVFGWPERTSDLEYFYPVSFQNAGYDIIFFWVARMIMAGYEFTGQAPFPQVYIHGMLKDELGRWMSKSLGNSPDPIEIIDEFGADAVRYTMMAITAPGHDAVFSRERVEMGRNFANKLWNAARLVLMNSQGLQVDDWDLNRLELTLADRWILSRINRVTASVTRYLEEFRFNEMASTLYDFIWHDYCDWFLELTKRRSYRPTISDDKRLAQIVLLVVLDRSLRLLHPVMPFITEEIWQKIRDHLKTVRIEEEVPRGLTIAPWPEVEEHFISEAAEEEMGRIQEIIVAIRNIRAEMNVPPNKEATVLLRADDEVIVHSLTENSSYIEQLGAVEKLAVGIDIKKPPVAASSVVHGVEVYLPLEGLIDLDVERKRLEREVTRLGDLIEKSDKKLHNEDFLARAPREVVELEKKRRVENDERIEKLKKNLAMLDG